MNFKKIYQILLDIFAEQENVKISVEIEKEEKNENID